MDFLDPRKRRHHSIRLMIGYVLMAIAIILTAYLLVYWAYGYSYDSKSGQVVENGLLFVDSDPGSAQIFLNGQDRSTTSARLNLQAGNYELILKKDGYQDWQRKFLLNEHNVLRITYPLLVAKQPKIDQLKSYTNSPAVLSSSPDRRWLVVLPQNGQLSPTFEMFDTANPAKAPQSLSLPSSVLNGAGRPGSNLSVIEWADDNDHLLLKHIYDGGIEFILFDRNSPAASVNLNRHFNSNPTDVSLVDKSAERLYLHNQTDGSLLTGTIAQANLQNLIKEVLAFKSIDTNLVFYVTAQGAPTGEVAAKIWEDGRDYQVTTFKSGSKYFVEAARSGSHWYYVAGSDKSGRLNLYRDPLDSLKNQAIAKAKPMLALTNSSPQNLRFSANSRFIGAQDGQKLSVYDTDTESRFQVNLTVNLAEPLKWMDGHHWLGLSDGMILMMDFDSQNQYAVAPSAKSEAVFDKDYNRMFNLVTAADGKSTILQMTDLRAGQDLPND